MRRPLRSRGAAGTISRDAAVISAIAQGLLVARPAAADVVAGADDEARLVGKQKRHDVGDLRRRSGAAHGNAAHTVLAEPVGHLALHARRLDERGRDAVDPHAMRRELLGPRLGEADHGGLARCIDGQILRPVLAGDGGDGDDGTALALHHVRHDEARRGIDGLDVEAVDAVDLRIRRFPHGLDRPEDAGVVDEPVDLAEALERGSGHALERAAVGHVRFDG